MRYSVGQRGVQILVEVHYEGDFESEGEEASIHIQDAPGIICFEGQSVPKAQVRIIRGGALNALIAGEGTPNAPDNSFFCAGACATMVQTATRAPMVRCFRDISPPEIVCSLRRAFSLSA